MNRTHTRIMESINHVLEQWNGKTVEVFELNNKGGLTQSGKGNLTVNEKDGYVAVNTWQKFAASIDSLHVISDDMLFLTNEDGMSFAYAIIRLAKPRYAEKTLRESVSEKWKNKIRQAVANLWDSDVNDAEFQDSYLTIPSTDGAEDSGTFYTWANNLILKNWIDQGVSGLFEDAWGGISINLDAIESDKDAETIVWLLDWEDSLCMDWEYADDLYWDELERAVDKACPDYDYMKKTEFMQFIDRNGYAHEQIEPNYSGHRIEIEQDWIDEFEED